MLTKQEENVYPKFRNKRHYSVFSVYYTREIRRQMQKFGDFFGVKQTFVSEMAEISRKSEAVKND